MSRFWEWEQSPRLLAVAEPSYWLFAVSFWYGQTFNVQDVHEIMSQLLEMEPTAGKQIQID